jgi:hypothetical protein
MFFYGTIIARVGIIVKSALFSDVILLDLEAASSEENAILALVFVVVAVELGVRVGDKLV